MKKTRSSEHIVGRRAELMAELFLQDLNPLFISRSRTDSDIGFDFFVGFRNANGGTNTIGVVVKGTAREVLSVYVIDALSFKRLLHSNVPGLLLVVEVKDNKLFYAWHGQFDAKFNSEAKTVGVPLTQVNVTSTRELRKKLTA
jgi:hypothetical protein